MKRILNYCVAGEPTLEDISAFIKDITDREGFVAEYALVSSYLAHALAENLTLEAATQLPHLADRFYQMLEEHPTVVNVEHPCTGRALPVAQCNEVDTLTVVVAGVAGDQRISAYLDGTEE